jgi:hypothetical protein
MNLNCLQWENFLHTTAGIPDKGNCRILLSSFSDFQRIRYKQSTSIPEHAGIQTAFRSAGRF